MKPTFTKAVISSFKIEGKSERTLRAELDGVNGIIWLEQYHADKTLNVDKTEVLSLSYDDLKRLMRAIDQM